MALINCRECQHPLSSNAKICPNCSAPRQLNDNIQQVKVKNATSRNMTNSKKVNLSQPILYILIGALLMHFGSPYFIKKETNPDEKYYARVDKINGLLVYVNSHPINQDAFKTIANMQVNDIQKIWKSLGIGKDNLGQVVLNMFNAGNENLVFSNLIHKLTIQVRENYPEASGVILNDKLNRCEIVQFHPVK